MKRDELKTLASLSKIKLTNKELKKFSKDMDIILSSVETLESFEENTKSKARQGIREKIKFCELRKDIVGKSITQEDALANSPRHENGYFKVVGNTFNEENP